MAQRIIWAFLLGFAFLFAVMQGLPWVMVAIGIPHAVAKYEHSGLTPDLPGWARALHILFAICIWFVASLSLMQQAPVNLFILIIAIVGIAYAISTAIRYERGSEGAGLAGHMPHLLSLITITLPFAFIAAIAMDSANVPYLILLIGASWGADSGAIFAGKYFGSQKLAPRLSPKKTVEGVIGGMITCGAIWAAVPWLFELHAPVTIFLAGQSTLMVSLVLAAIGMAIALVGVFGDLCFSMFKRQANAKDYSKLIPGHGGVLDRFDSMLFVAPFVFLLTVL